jgi:hypothetical protein
VGLLVLALSPSAEGAKLPRSLPSDGAWAYVLYNSSVPGPKTSKREKLILTSKIKLYSPYSYLCNMGGRPTEMDLVKTTGLYSKEIKPPGHRADAGGDRPDPTQRL